MLTANGQGLGLDLGQLAPDVATVERMVRDRNERMRKLRLKAGRPAPPPLLLFEDYCAAVGRLPQLTRQAQRGDEGSPSVTALVRLGNGQRLTPDFEGWMRYLGLDQNPIDRAMIHPRYQRGAVFPERGLTESVLVVAQRGWGKSTLLKALIRAQIEAPRDTNPTGAVVVLDPGGDLARQVARWPELSGPDRAGDRLVYVEPRLQRGLTVGFNPLDGTGLDEESRSDVAGFLVEAIGNLVADLTLAMRNLIRTCCRVLLWTPGSTLRDLYVMLGGPDEPGAAALHTRACTYPDEDVRGFFLHRFGSDAYRQTREYLRSRIEELLFIHDLGGMFAGSATVDLRAAVEARKIVLVNLAKFENEEELRTAGRLLATMVIAIAKRRAQNPDAPRPPIHLVIDEATVLAGNELVRALAQCRKYGLNLILAQQVMASGFSPADKETLVKNTGCRFVGGRDRRTVADVLSNGSEIADALPKIEPRQFWAEWAGDGPHLLNVRSDLADRGPGIGDAEWLGFVASITAPGSGYYRPTKPDPAARSDPATTVLQDAPDTVPALAAGDVAPAAVPARKSRAKPASVTVKERKPRSSKATKPLASTAKAPDVKPSGRTLDD